jgi:hypothetical protein
MTEHTFNIYCDESCHLEHDRIPIMVLGALWCPTERASAIARRVRDIKEKHGLAPDFEVKWTKVSPAKAGLYLDLVDYFFDEDDLHFRGVLISDKSVLNHKAFNQTHDTWYYKMCFTMLEPLVDPRSHYRVYLDIKDTRGERKRAKLEEVLRNSRHDSVGQIIERVQQIRSHESDLMQLADLLIGAIAHHSRSQTGDLQRQRTSDAKQQVIRRIQGRSGKSLVYTTWLWEPKFNVLRWQPGGHL